MTTINDYTDILNDEITLIVEEIQAEQITTVNVPGLGNVVSTFVCLPPHPGSSVAVYRVAGFRLNTHTPAVVQIQPRQCENSDLGLHDVFGVMLNVTSSSSMIVTVRRLDSAGGWGQRLRLDFLIIESVRNP